MMIQKLTKIFALYLVILACSSIEAQFKFEPPGQIPFAGGIMQPLVSSPQFDPTESDARQQLTIDERIQGSSSDPNSGLAIVEPWSL